MSATLNTKRLREVLDHAEEYEGAPGVAWGEYILDFNEIRRLIDAHDRLWDAEILKRVAFEEQCG